ncbi:MAG: hypothetical protein FWH20_01185 [Oscillospiraceae bacterium]|nr:hypothetical protein [Oscillospiraceae bacterium]
MVKLIHGRRGSGKTKILIDAIHTAAGVSKGNVVAIQIGSSLNGNIKPKVRLINIEEYKVAGCSELYGFIAGLMASDYDCTDIFIDGLLKIVGTDFEEVAKLIDRVNEISDSTCITFTISAAVEELPESVKKYV